MKNRFIFLAVWMVCTIALASGSYFKGGHVYSDAVASEPLYVGADGQVKGFGPVTFFGSTGDAVNINNASDSHNVLSVTTTTGGTFFKVSSEGFVYNNSYQLNVSEYDNGNSSTGPVAIDWKAHGVSQRIKATGNFTLTLANPQTGGAYVIKLVNDGTARTITYPGTVLWPGGTVPTLTGTNNKVDLLNFYWDGTSYYGSSSLNY